MLALLQARVGVVEDVQSLGERRHDAVFDAVVDHLHEVPGTRRTAVQVAALLGGVVPRAPGRALDVAGSRRDRAQNGLEVGDGLVVPAHHEAVAALEAEHAAAGPDVDVVDAGVLQLRGPTHVVAVVGVAAVDDDVAGFEDLGDLVDDRAGEPGGDHQPHGAGLLELGREVRDARRARGALRGQGRHGILVHVVDHAVVAVLHESADDVGAHPSESDHGELHPYPIRLNPPRRAALRV